MKMLQCKQDEKSRMKSTCKAQRKQDENAAVQAG